MGVVQVLFESYKAPLENTQTAYFYRFCNYDTKLCFDSNQKWFFVLNPASETKIQDS